jgi:hypothetical protein
MSSQHRLFFLDKPLGSGMFSFLHVLVDSDRFPFFPLHAHYSSLKRNQRATFFLGTNQQRIRQTNYRHELTRVDWTLDSLFRTIELELDDGLSYLDFIRSLHLDLDHNPFLPRITKFATIIVNILSCYKQSYFG